LFDNFFYKNKKNRDLRKLISTLFFYYISQGCDGNRKE
jgi:hypothetical protein